MTATILHIRRWSPALGLALTALLLLLLSAQAAPPKQTATLEIPLDAAGITLDGNCREYDDAVQVTYAGPADSTGVVYLRHSNKYLYVCARAGNGSFSQRFFSLYLDADNGRELFAEADDYALRVRVVDSELDALAGTGQGGYVAGGFPGSFDAAAIAGNGDTRLFDTVEYEIPLPNFYRCGQPFGIAFYQHNVRTINDDYGWPSTQFYDSPQSWVEATLLDSGCPSRAIQVCHLENNECPGAAAATLYHVPAGGAPTRLELDESGFARAPEQVANGDTLWATMTISQMANSTLYHTSLPVIASNDAVGRDGVLRLATGPERPLLVQDMAVSAQWMVTDDPAYRAQLADNLAQASAYFYDFTAGQFMLGDILVYQNGEQWDTADIRLYPSNVNRPNATIGGIVDSVTPDIAPTVAISYAPGVLAMGKEWNRYMAAPGEQITVDGEPVDPLTLVDDWSIALAHELGHYLLFLYDTYLDAEGNQSQTLIEQCFGSAMGNAYAPINQSFVWDADHWASGCGATLAYAETGGRTEWQTIQGWYEWAVPPMGPQPLTATAPMTPPVNLTTVTFVTPAELPAQPLAASQLFDLRYVDDEATSYEARAFTFRDDRIYDQGKPPAGLNQVTLTDARLDDRLCVYDLNDHGEAAIDEATPRYQFGCELIAPNDAELVMSKDVAWRPLIEAKQIDPTQIVISVTQELSDPAASLMLRVYPEDQAGYPPVSMNRAGALHTYTVDFAAFDAVVMPIFMQVWIDESMAAPQSARESIADRGTGGGGAFGAAWHGGGVLVLSSDGHASFAPEGGRLLLPGESIAWQSMPGTPPLPADKRIVGQSYRLDAFPVELADNGTVALEFEAASIPPAGARATAAGDPVLHFYDGRAWQPLTTAVQPLDDRTDGWQLASAPSAGVGIYALFTDQPARAVWLPLVR